MLGTGLEAESHFFDRSSAVEAHASLAHCGRLLTEEGCTTLRLPTLGHLCADCYGLPAKYELVCEMNEFVFPYVPYNKILQPWVCLCACVPS